MNMRRRESQPQLTVDEVIWSIADDSESENSTSTASVEQSRLSQQLHVPMHGLK